MLKKILLDNQEFHFTKSHLPTLIHGEAHAGSSLFTMSMIADFYSQGLKILAITGFSIAREEFVEQTTDEDSVGSSQVKRAIFLVKENVDSFLRLTKELPDIKERIILIKNIELFEEDFFNAIKDFDNVVISGDVNKCSYKEVILQKSFNTKIYFSALEGSHSSIPSLRKYQGYIASQNEEGVVSLAM